MGLKEPTKQPCTATSRPAKLAGPSSRPATSCGTIQAYAPQLSRCLYARGKRASGRHSSADGCQARNAVFVAKLLQVLSAIAAIARDWRPESKAVQDTLSLREADQCSNNDNGYKNCERDVSFRYSLTLTVSRCEPFALVIHESASLRDKRGRYTLLLARRITPNALTREREFILDWTLWTIALFCTGLASTAIVCDQPPAGLGGYAPLPLDSKYPVAPSST
jgi:hypothetical protein